MNNSIISLTTFLVLLLIALGAARLGKTAIFVTSAMFIILSNITVTIPIDLFRFGPGDLDTFKPLGQPIVFSLAIIIYSVVYFLADIVCNQYGKSSGYKLAASNLGVQLVLWAYVWLSSCFVPESSGAAQFEAMKSMFSTSAQISFAAIVASAGPFLDVYVFDVVRQKWDKITFVKRFVPNPHLSTIIRMKLSTIVGQTVNTIIFFSIALLGNEAINAPTLVSIIVTAAVIKCVIALLDIPAILIHQRWLVSPER